MKTEKKLEGSIHLNRYSGGSDEVFLEVTDKLSGTAFLRAYFKTHKDALNLFTNRSAECEFKFNPEYVGMKHEHKFEFIYFSREYRDEKTQLAAAKKALKPYEVDGWRGNPEDLTNHHRWNIDKQAWQVGFHRFVPIKD